MDTMTIRQLAEKYPVCSNQVSSISAWQQILERWRTDNKLEQRKHWRYGPSETGSRQLSRYYNVARIVRLICLEARAHNPRPRPRVSLLYQEYFDEFAEILQKEADIAKEAKEAREQANQA